MSAYSLKKYLSLFQVIKDSSLVMMPLSGSEKTWNRNQDGFDGEK